MLSLFIYAGPVLNSLRVWVNNEILPSIDENDGRAYIMEFITRGENVTRIETTGPHFNAAKSHSDILYSAGPPMFLEDRLFDAD